MTMTPPSGPEDAPPPPQYSSTKDAKAHAKAEKAYRKASRPWFKKKRFWLLGLVGFLIVIVALSSGSGDDDADSPAATTPAASPSESASAVESAAPGEDAVEEEATEEEATEEEAEEEEPAPLMEVTAQQMIEDLEANALAAANNYKGQRVAVTGYVSNIDASGDYFTLRGDDEYSFTNIMFFIDESHLDVVSGFTSGQEVTVTGLVTDVGEILGYSIDTEDIG